MKRNSLLIYYLEDLHCDPLDNRYDYGISSLLIELAVRETSGQFKGFREPHQVKAFPWRELSNAVFCENEWNIVATGSHVCRESGA